MKRIDSKGFEKIKIKKSQYSGVESDKCPCGSGLPKSPLHDARGIFVDYVCDVCENKKRAKYRPEIFEDSGYEADEPIEPEEEIGGHSWW